MAALVAIQRPELLNGVVFSAPAILPAAGPILVCINWSSLYSHHYNTYVIQRGITRATAFFAPQLEVRKVDPNTISRIPEEVRTYRVHMYTPCTYKLHTYIHIPTSRNQAHASHTCA